MPDPWGGDNMSEWYNPCAYEDEEKIKIVPFASDRIEKPEKKSKTLDEEKIERVEKNASRLLDAVNELNVTRLLDEIQASIVLSGGQKISCEELKQMSLGKILDLTIPNGITWKIRPSKKCFDS